MTSSHPSPLLPAHRIVAALTALALVAGCSREAAAPVVASQADVAAAAPDPSLQPAPQPVPAPAPAPIRAAAAVRTTSPAVAPQAPYEPEYADGGVPYADGAPEQVVSAYVEPALSQPAPVEVLWAPPPMLVEEPPPQPDPEYVWTGGCWAWQGRWIWNAGRWARPPRPRYTWQEPYYEHRSNRVVYVPGYWQAPESRFVAPAAGVAIALAIVAVGVHAGHAPEGPQGVFIPPPPGSRPGLIVPAPIGTPPAVVIGAPPVIHAGMRVDGGGDRHGRRGGFNDNRITNNVTNVTNVTNVRNVTVIVPATATADGRGFQNSVPAQPHLAASMRPVVRDAAPQPVSNAAIPMYRAGHPPANLPPPQPVR
ncbi:MAG: hypothetical protein ABW032_05030, partial [Burkholderiaceae bacterium]